ncbi:hypothetical protein [Xenorhabdus stockiae]|uniref:hypothetical protein n=1 Tax=Xenorhabdus stockiae TaxID=351614 RepID=UPI00406371C4
MSKEHSLKLKLDGTTPDSLPMARLAKYLTALSSLYGEASEVRFESVTEGSVEIHSYVKTTASYEAVKAHIHEQIHNRGKPYRDLIDLVTTDNLKGEIYSSDSSLLGVIRPSVDEKLLTITKNAKVQGELYSISGKETSVMVKLRGANNEILNCEASQEDAIRLAQYLFKKIRVQGRSEWVKKNGEWKLKKLIIKHFSLLENVRIQEGIQRLAEDKNNKWDEVENPSKIIRLLRNIS